jgi:hypothetical protein
MMISRRPKRRASSEKAPGPSKTSAADIAARLKRLAVAESTCLAVRIPGPGALRSYTAQCGATINDLDLRFEEMPVSVNLQTVYPRKLAAVRREVAPVAVGSAWGPALGKVWDFIRSQPGLRTDGHNIFLYHHPTQPDGQILCDFGVEVTRMFETAGEVYATETPGSQAADHTFAGTTKTNWDCRWQDYFRIADNAEVTSINVF